MVWRWLARGVAAAHFGFLAYLVVGGFLARRRRRTIALHAAAAVWGALIVAAPIDCPLTALQNRLRVRGGLPPLDTGFIQTYIAGRCYPAERERGAQLAAAAVVLASWVGLVRNRRTATPALGQRDTRHADLELAELSQPI
jgi:Protein of Unknown function (DUF2784)